LETGRRKTEPVLSKEMIGGIAHSELAGDALYDL
jgi:hypothetical protein